LYAIDGYLGLTLRIIAVNIMPSPGFDALRMQSSKPVGLPVSLLDIIIIIARIPLAILIMSSLSALVGLHWQLHQSDHSRIGNLHYIKALPMISMF
jgi:hypothetical protein